MNNCAILISDYRGVSWGLYYYREGSPDKVGKELKSFIQYIVDATGPLVSSDFILILNAFNSDYEINTGPHEEEEYFYKIFIDRNHISIECRYRGENSIDSNRDTWPIVENFSESYDFHKV